MTEAVREGKPATAKKKKELIIIHHSEGIACFEDIALVAVIQRLDKIHITGPGDRIWFLEFDTSQEAHDAAMVLAEIIGA